MTLKTSETRNKGGRPRKELSITSQLREYLIRNPYVIQKLVKALIDQATKYRSLGAQQEILNRIDGKVIEKHEIDGQGLPVMLVFRPAEPKALPEANIIEGEAREIDDS